MKHILTVFIVAALIGAGCVSAKGTSADLSGPDHSSKTVLIRNAEHGSVMAMLNLNRKYGFPGTAQGVAFFSRWDPATAQKASPQNFTALADVYMENRDMFINAAAKAWILYKKASDQGFVQADLKWISLELAQGNFTRVDQLEKNVLSSLDPKLLEQLYNIYAQRYDCVSRRANIVRIIAERGNILPVRELLNQISSFNGDSKKILDLAEQVRGSNRPDIMLELAKYLKRHHEYAWAVKLLETAKHQDPFNGEIDMALYRCYRNRQFVRDRTEAEKKQIACLARGAENGNIAPSIRLLEIYQYRWNTYQAEYAKLVAKLNETGQGRVALGKFYLESKQVDQALAILEKEAALDNQKAIITLALMPEDLPYNPEAHAATEKWQAYSLSGRDFSLWRAFVDRAVNIDMAQPDLFKSIGDQASAFGDIHVLRLLYEQNLYGYGSTEALVYLERAANAGDVKSVLDLADLYLGRPGQEQKGIALLTALGDKGSVRGLKRLGKFYHSPPYKSGIKADETRSIACYKRAAQLGDVETLISLGQKFVCPTCNPLGLITAQEGLSYLETAAAMGQADANYYLGWYYHYGAGDACDLEKARTYFELSLAQGNDQAYEGLAHLYFGENVLRKDDAKALSYIEKGSRAKISGCTNLLGIFYLHGYGGLKQDREKAAALFKTVANYNPYAATNLGEYYMDKKEYAKARETFKSAVASGVTLAQRKLGFLYQTGKGGKPEIKKALDLYLKAYEAEPDDETAFNLGLIYIAGEGGIKKDLATAKKWLERSNFPEAKKWLKSIGKNAAGDH
jgi:TPR repeat protein